MHFLSSSIPEFLQWVFHSGSTYRYQLHIFFLGECFNIIQLNCFGFSGCKFWKVIYFSSRNSIPFTILKIIIYSQTKKKLVSYTDFFSGLNFGSQFIRIQMGKTDSSSPLKAQKKYGVKSEKIWYISSKKYIVLFIICNAKMNKL